LEYDLQYDHFDEIIQIIKSITSEEILSLAKQYFDPASFHEVVVGKME
jgi:predicted Zn-dependent peptidase